MSAAMVRELFGADATLYTIFGVPKTAPAADIKKAYWKLALRYVRCCCPSCLSDDSVWPPRHHLIPNLP